MAGERRLKTGHLLAALALVVLGVVIGWATDAGDGSERGEQPSADVGPTRTENGVPVGYERSREGAVAAALNYGRVSARPEFVTDPGRREEILKALATPEAARRYEGQGAAALASLADTPLYRATREGTPVIWQTTPLGYRVERYSDDEAVVMAWSVGTFGAGDATPRAVFGSDTARLRWREGDWKIAGDAGREEEGPTPALAEGVSPTPAREFRDRLRGLQGLRYVP